MRNVLILCVVALMVLLANGQGDGKYRAPAPKPSAFRPNQRGGGGGGAGDGKYRAPAPKPNQGGGDGKYHPVNDGKYNPNDDGRYDHLDVGGGLYSGGGGQYTGNTDKIVGGGEYSGKPDKYVGYVEKRPDPTTTRATTTTRAPTTTRGPTTTRAPRTTTKRVTVPTKMQGPDGWKILRDEKAEEEESYRFLYQTENEILAEEAGKIEQLTPDSQGLRKQGFYQYVGDDGILYRVDYIADDKGFLPIGEHIPKK